MRLTCVRSSAASNRMVFSWISGGNARSDGCRWGGWNSVGCESRRRLTVRGTSTSCSEYGTMLCLYNVDGRTRCGSQQRLQLPQGVAADGRHGQQPQPTIRRGFKHPGGHLYASIKPFLFQTAQTQGLPTFDEHLVESDRTAAPGMPRITDAPPLSIMGVELWASIIANGTITDWATN
jgi:hypothetical protein